MNKININIDLFNAIANYLGTRPFNEVVQLINAMQQAAQEQQSQDLPPPQA